MNFLTATSGIVNSAVSGALQSGNNAGASLNQGGASTVAGGASIAGIAFRTGADVGQMFLDGLASNFGPSGQAVSRFAGLLTRTLGDVLNDTVSGIGSTLKFLTRGAGAIAGAGLAGAGALGGAAIGSTLGIGGMVTGAGIGLAGGALVGSLATKIAGEIGSAVGGVLGAGGRILGHAGDLITGTFKTALDLIKEMQSATEQWGSRVAAVQAQTGLSARGAAAASLNFQSVGLENTFSSLAGGGMANAPWLYAQRSRSFGLPDYTNANFLPAAASRFQELQQGGRAGQMRAGFMAQTLGLNSPEALRVLQIDPARLRAQQQTTANFSAGLGLDPREIRRISDETFLLNREFQTLGSITLMKLSQTALPTINRALEQAANFITAHAGDISKGIEDGFYWLIYDFPVGALQAGSAAGQALGNFLLSTADFADGLRSHLPQIAVSLQGFLANLREFAANTAGVAAFIAQAVRSGAALLGLVPSGGGSGAATAATGTVASPTSTPGGVAPTVTSGAPPTVAPTSSAAPSATSSGAPSTAAPSSGFSTWLEEFLKTSKPPSAFRTSLLPPMPDISGWVTNAYKNTREEIGKFTRETLFGQQDPDAPPMKQSFDHLLNWGLGGAAIGVGVRKVGLPLAKKFAPSLVAGGLQLLSKLPPLPVIGAPFPGGALNPSLATGLTALRGLATPIGVGVGAGVLGYETLRKLSRAERFYGPFEAVREPVQFLTSPWRELPSTAQMAQHYAHGFVQKQIKQAFIPPSAFAPPGSPSGPSGGPMTAFNAAKGGVLGALPIPNFAARYGDPNGPVGARLESLSNGARNAGNAILERSAEAGNLADGWQKMMLSRLEAIERNTGKGADGTDKIGQNMGGFVEAVSHRTAGIVNDEVNANLSWSR